MPSEPTLKQSPAESPSANSLSTSLCPSRHHPCLTVPTPCCFQPPNRGCRFRCSAKGRTAAARPGNGSLFRQPVSAGPEQGQRHPDSWKFEPHSFDVTQSHLAVMTLKSSRHSDPVLDASKRCVPRGSVAPVLHCSVFPTQRCLASLSLPVETPLRSRFGTGRAPGGGGRRGGCPHSPGRSCLGCRTRTLALGR